jgi:16S rRNA (uracil1498-N3)-methyltransferase
MLRRFFVEEIRADNGTCLISGSEAKHISNVLRMRAGDRFILMDGRGYRFQAVIESTSSKGVRAILEKPLPKPPPSPVHITLCQALTKSRAMDYLLQKTSELGVDRVVPFYSERTTVRYKKERLVNKMRHWREIAISAAKQCGRSTPVAIDSPISFGAVMEKWRGQNALKVVLWEEEESKDLKSLMKLSPSADNFVGMIGPEGGFAEEEINIARNAGFIVASLGHRILRADTAAITTVAIVQYELGDLNIGSRV